MCSVSNEKFAHTFSCRYNCIIRKTKLHFLILLRIEEENMLQQKKELFFCKGLISFLCLAYFQHSFPFSFSPISSILSQSAQFALTFDLDCFDFQKCHICLMKPQGNGNALDSPKMVTCLAFYFLVIQFLFESTDMHGILEFCPFLNSVPP